MRTVTDCIHPSVSEGLSESNTKTSGRLGVHGDLLCLPEGTLGSSSDDECGRVPFSAIRLRTDAVKRFKKVENATAMISKLLTVAEKRFRTLKGSRLLPAVYAGDQFVDEVKTHKSKFEFLKRKAA